MFSEPPNALKIYDNVLPLHRIRIRQAIPNNGDVAAGRRLI